METHTRIFLSLNISVVVSMTRSGRIFPDQSNRKFTHTVMDIMNFYKKIGSGFSQWSSNYCIFLASIFRLSGLKSKEESRKKSTVITIEKPTNGNQQKFDLHKFLPLQCQYCNRRFPNEAILQWHVSTEHESTGKLF